MASTVYIVDDDRDVRSSISFMLGTSGMQTRPFLGGVDLLESVADLEPGCILLDIRMPDMDGVEVLEELARRDIRWPVIMMTGHGEVALAVQTMKLGAVDFIEKPFEEEGLISCIKRALTALERETSESERKRDAALRIESLTPREREVLQGLMTGASNKAIANQLGISLRTAEMHRSNMMQRLGAKSLAEALRLATEAGLEPTA